MLGCWEAGRLQTGKLFTLAPLALYFEHFMQQTNLKSQAPNHKMLGGLEAGFGLQAFGYFLATDTHRQTQTFFFGRPVRRKYSRPARKNQIPNSKSQIPSTK